MKMTWKASIVLALFMLAGCAGMPSLSLTPVSVDATVGGEHETGVEEDNMVKVQTGDTSTVEYVTDTVEQTYNEIQEYPRWLIIAFALVCPSPFPSPVSAWRGRRERKQMSKQIGVLTTALERSVPSQEKL
tara:strand:- start:394 stop:786 length:393 start_codon:yes stop_codon:yes gene_type:complete